MFLVIAIYFCINRGFIIIKRVLIKYIGFSKNVDIPVDVYAIAYRAFSGNKKIESIVIPSGLNIIYDEAFRDCENLKKIDFVGQGINQINPYAFTGCTNLKEIKLPIVMVLGLAPFSFSGCTGLEKIILPEFFFVDNTIPSGAFADCINLKEVVISKNIKYISENAFIGCDNLEKITEMTETELKGL